MDKRALQRALGAYLALRHTKLCTKCGRELRYSPRYAVYMWWPWMWTKKSNRSGVRSRAAHSRSQLKPHLNLAGVVSTKSRGWVPQSWNTSNPYSYSCLPSKHVFVSMQTFFAIRPCQGVTSTCPDMVRWVNGKFSYEQPGTLGSPLGYVEIWVVL